MTDIKEMVELLKDLKSWAISIWLVLLVILFFTVTAKSAEPPRYDGTFTDEADLQRQVDSILAVCDTVWIDSIRVDGYDTITDSGWVEIRYPSEPLVYSVTCRKFVCRDVKEMPKPKPRYSNIYYREGYEPPPEVIPGRFTLYWREVER